MENNQRLPLTSSILNDVRILFRTIQAHSRTVEASCGIGDSKLWLLWEIAHSPSARVSELARKLGIHLSTCSNLLDALQRHGLITRDRGEEDHRQVKVKLTQAGEQLLANAPKPAQGALNSALGRMSTSELQDLQTALTRLLQQLGASTSTTGHPPLGEPLPEAKT